MGLRRPSKLTLFTAAGPGGALALAVLPAGWVVVAVLSITPLVVPALLGFRFAVGLTVSADARLANALLGTAARPPLASPRADGYWRRGGNVVRDEAFWQQQAYLLVRMTLGFGVAVAEWTLLAASLGLLAMPIWYRWSDTWQVDSLGRALLCVPIGSAGLALALALLGPLARWSRALVG